MKVISIKDMVRKDVPIYYRKLFTGIAVIDLNEKQTDFRIDFAIEYKPTGHKEIAVNFLDHIDYPIVPVARELKQYIFDLDYVGGLPD
ncbi:MAG: hypothetical protein LBC80_09665 [Treponema sp.]|jgi:hypothetical protein|nr:hypothetical protein [Treponema sp.]